MVRLAAILGIILMIAGGVALWMRLSGMSAPVIAVSAIPRPVAEPAAQAQAASTPVAPVTAPAARQAPPVAVPEAQQIRVRPPTVAQAPSVEEDTVPEKPAEKPVEEAPVAAPRTPPSTRGLQMWLPFSFTIQPGANLSPSHLMAAVTGAVRVVEDAQRHHVARFDGHGSIAFANPADGAFTLTCWLRTTQDANPAGGEEGASWRQGTGVIAGDVPGGKADFGLCTLAGRCAFGSGAPDVTLLSTGRVNDGAWHHIAAVRDGVGNLTLYIDGHNDGTRPGGLEPRDATTRLTVGSLQNGTHGFIGDLDEVRVYDRPLEDDEIASMFASEQVTDH